ncbi:hypothetical protein BUALT_Bualt08G0021500 [Buddleja alternifolia]|uniref:RNase H type-1 domain-containing protein n=1 Tax=Buddleja alternifolia TaxID=168488 RepID=A0AAV6XDW2_9LAMI|nr:hypothetical protein BUALT_Bualt08G0021500 [Buddleja alternifolia]
MECPCPFCGSDRENSKHAFLECPFVRLVWGLSDLPWPIISFCPSTTWLWVRHVQAKLGKEEFNFFITVCWFIWHNRNKSIMEKLTTDPDVLIRKARVYCSSYKEALEVCPPLVEEEKDLRWIPPAIGRDSTGSCCAWRQQRLDFSTTPEVAEALVAVEALKPGISRGWRDVVLEGDCLSLIRRLRSPALDLSPIGSIIDDCFLLVASFNSVSFSFVFLCSSIVKAIGLLTVSLELLWVCWKGIPSPLLVSLISFDLTLLNNISTVFLKKKKKKEIKLLRDLRIPIKEEMEIFRLLF